MEVSGQLHTLADLPLGKEPPDTHWIGGWVGPRAGLDVMVKRKISNPCQASNTCSSSPKPSAIPLRYPGSPSYVRCKKKIRKRITKTKWVQ